MIPPDVSAATPPARVSGADRPERAGSGGLSRGRAETRREGGVLGGGQSPPPDPGRWRPPRRVVWIAFGISALLHVLAIVIYPLLVGPPAGVPLPPEGTLRPQRPTGTEVVRLSPVEGDATPAEEPVVRPLPETATPVTVPPPAEGGTPEGEDVPAGRAPSAAELLRPRMGDPRLWRPVDPEFFRLTDQEVLELQAAGRLQEWSDSVAAVADARRRATDWTYTDEEGKRWGVSPGRIHLGDVTIPLGTSTADPRDDPRNSLLGVNPAYADEVSERSWRFADIARGAAAAAIRESLEARAAAIRARRDAERGERRDTIPR